MSDLRESKTERVTMAVTPREKKRLQVVCGVDDVTESDLIRDLVMPHVDARHAEIVAAVPGLADADAA